MEPEKLFSFKSSFRFKREYYMGPEKDGFSFKEVFVWGQLHVIPSHIVEFRGIELRNYIICPCIVGGKPDIPSGLPKDYYRGFKGCVGYVFIQDKELHLYNDRHEINSSIDFCH